MARLLSAAILPMDRCKRTSSSPPTETGYDGEDEDRNHEDDDDDESDWVALGSGGDCNQRRSCHSIAVPVTSALHTASQLSSPTPVCLVRTAPLVQDFAVRIPGLSGWTSKKELTRLVQPFLEPGEAIRHILIGYQSILEPHWTLVVTDRAILVLDPGVVRPGLSRWVKGKEVRRLPRATRLGPIHGRGWIVVDGQPFFVPGNRRRIAAIDDEAGLSAATD